ncbi:MAG: hypothetical protein ABL879_06480 [Devosia sp.]
MRIRLLPVVIFAAIALLLFKGIGLVSNGSYVLTGTDTALAEGAAPAHAEAAASVGGTTAQPEVTLEDTAPTIEDTSPTVKVSAEAAAGHGEAAQAEGHGDSSAATSSEALPPAPSSEAPAEVAAVPSVACPTTEPVAADAAAHGPEATAPAEAAAPSVPADCVEVPKTAEGDAVPTTRDAKGMIVPLSEVSGDKSEAALLARLGERRAELDQFAADLDTRLALVEAAEKRIDERTAQLKELEAQINALVDQKEAAEDSQFKAVVNMYENMKPRDAAKIFNGLDLRVLVRVARAMNPRKMSPILAAMDAQRAKDLTAVMATDLPPALVADTTGAGGEDLANLPQIQGQ